MKRSLVNLEFVSLSSAEPMTCGSSVNYYRQGEVLADAGEYAEALASFDQAIALQPNCDAVWVFRAVVLIHLEQYQEALLSCDRAIQIYPTNSEAWTFRGVALHRLGRYAEAYASYERATGKASVSFWQKLRQQGVSLFWKASL